MERARRRRREGGPQAPLAQSIVLPASAATAERAAEMTTVQVIWGPVAEQMVLGGMTVQEVRKLLQRAYNIPAHAAVVVNGRPVDGSYRLAAADVIEFVRLAGEKGA